MASDQNTDPGPRGPSILGVDTGGTFTDFVFFDNERLQVAKRASTPAAPERAVIDGVAGFDTRPARLVHGSTVATNAVLEGKLARTVYIANTGLADVLTIGRQARAELYNLQPAPQPPPVPARLCLAVNQRTAADGSQVQALDDGELADLVAHVESLGAEAVAVNLLFSFLDGEPERRIADALPEGLYVSISSQVLPEYKEYERGIATWLNAALGPRMGVYLGRLREVLGDMAIMHGAAGTVDVEQASQHAVNLLLSGPAAGLLGARYVGELAGRERLLTLDMGGTSTDVALVDGEIGLTSEGTIAGYPVAVPMVDMHTIGAGGGSIAYLDAGDMLRVGPESAGAEPGPACYGKGGEQPTVTDANVVLGRLPASTRLGGDMAVDVECARAALAPLAERMGLEVEAAAGGVIAVANEAMAGALRVISVQRGEDPREFTLLSFGGAGGLHVCALAEAMGMGRALVPVYAGVLSALGMLVARRSRQLSQSILAPLSQVDGEHIEVRLQQLRERGQAQLTAEGVEATEIEESISLDLRYAGQSFSLNLPWRGLDGAAEDFHAAHEARYGHRLEVDIELVNIRLGLSGPRPQLPLPKLAAAGDDPSPHESVRVWGHDQQVPVYERERLAAGQTFEGPAIVRESVSTTWIEAGWRCKVDGYGNLLLES